MTDGNTQTVLTAMGRFSTGDLEGYLELYDPGIVLHGYGPEPLVGLDAVRGFYEAIFAAFSDIELVSHDELVDGDQVATRFTMSATHTGEFWGAPASGVRASADGITILRFAGGKCVERWSSFDFLSLLTQIGALPAPAPA